MQPLTVAINAQISPTGGHGGVIHVLQALLQALGNLDDGDEQYIIITPHDNPHWLEPYLGDNMRLVQAPAPQQRFSGRTPRHLRPLLQRLRQTLIDIIGGDMLDTYPHVPISDGFYESLGADVIHFPYQAYIICSLPSVFNPHDLQHKYFPAFFSPKALRGREVLYRTACQYAQTVAVGSDWVKQDVMQHYALPADKVQVIPVAPFSSAFELPSDPASIRQAYNLPDTYMLYPAVTWQHKNHLRLLDALANLRDNHDLHLQLVCTGSLNDYYHHTIKPHIDTRNLTEQVHFLGHIPGDDLRALYHEAQFVIQPSLFEASSSMLWEAAQEGVPAIASDIATIQEQAGDDALLFDPFDVDDIADKIRRVATNADLRESLAEHGQQRLRVVSWERTAKAYRALYRKLARVPLSEEDQHLLTWNWMKDDR